MLVRRQNGPGSPENDHQFPQDTGTEYRENPLLPPGNSQLWHV